ncbi:hypothetical protein DCM91_20695 [Chitinophaga costaii]|nr:hypothetical protein DCM91_20695 [Chitinophaga costaii]
MACLQTILIHGKDVAISIIRKAAHGKIHFIVGIVCAAVVLLPEVGAGKAAGRIIAISVCPCDGCIKTFPGYARDIAIILGVGKTGVIINLFMRSSSMGYFLPNFPWQNIPIIIRKNITF